jgi:hypothetical protein
MATPALPFAQLATECEAEGLSPQNAEKIGHQLAKLFGVKEDEVGILRIEKRNLVFCYPAKLHNVGSIPLNTSTSVAVRTANSRRAEVINNFAQTKHTSVFEAVELSGRGRRKVRPPRTHDPKAHVGAGAGPGGSHRRHSGFAQRNLGACGGGGFHARRPTKAGGVRGRPGEVFQIAFSAALLSYHARNLRNAAPR